MRVIAGSHRGRRLSGPEGTKLRPTSDKVRGALFSILSSRVPGARFLDLFAGTGAIGIEALSRGAASVTFVECDQAALRLLRKNLTVCSLMNQADIQPVSTDVFLGRSEWWGGPFDIVFADPPYAACRDLDILWDAWTVGLVAPTGVMVIEQGSKSDLPNRMARAVLLRRYVYGDTALYLYGRDHTETVVP